MALHEQSVGATDEWFTPSYVIDSFECEFDMDVASPGQVATPWIQAKHFVTRNSLSVPWTGFIWMNPPFRPKSTASKATKTQPRVHRSAAAR
jgi:hypothetical protein